MTLEHLENLVQIGTLSQQELAEARKELIQAEIEGQKDIHEAQTVVRLTLRGKAMQAWQLALAGLQPELLVSISRDVDIVRMILDERWQIGENDGLNVLLWDGLTTWYEHVSMTNPAFRNTLYTHDNLYVLSGLDSELVVLIYLDPLKVPMCYTVSPYLIRIDDLKQAVDSQDRKVTLAVLNKEE